MVKRRLVMVKKVHEDDDEDYFHEHKHHMIPQIP
jgi:hypothetical protein